MTAAHRTSRASARIRHSQPPGTGFSRNQPEEAERRLTSMFPGEAAFLLMIKGAGERIRTADRPLTRGHNNNPVTWEAFTRRVNLGAY